MCIIVVLLQCHVHFICEIRANMCILNIWVLKKKPIEKKIQLTNTGKMLEKFNLFQLPLYKI